jgi:cyanophycinase-like exopeptidase
MTDELDTLQARLDALKAAYLQRNNLLCMYENGRPVKADAYEVRYRVTPQGYAWLLAKRSTLDALPVEWSWDANGSPVEGVR